MNQLQPHFAIFQGDMIYADNVIPTEREIPAELGGGVWVNDPAKDFVAITLDESFGMVDVSHDGRLKASLLDITGEVLYEKTMEAK